MWIHLDTLFWFRVNKSLLLFLVINGETINTNFINFGLIRPSLEPRSTALKTGTLTITPPIRFKTSLKMPNGYPEVVSQRTNNIIADKKRTKHYIEKLNNTNRNKDRREYECSGKDGSSCFTNGAFYVCVLLVNQLIG